MGERKIVLTSECACDLPREVLKKINVDIIHYHVHAGGYDYQSGTEINSENILEYMEEHGRRVHVSAPEVPEYRDFFEKNSAGTTPLLHLLPNLWEGKNKKNAGKAAEDFAQVTIFGSSQYSGGIGVLLLAAVREADQGRNVTEIAGCLRALERRMNFSLLTGDNFYRKGIKKGMDLFCDLLPVHPVLRLHQGELVSSYRELKVGKAQDNYRGYIRNVFRRSNADPSILVLVHAGCSYEQQQELVREVEKYVKFEHIIVSMAGAAFVCAFGAGSISLQFLNET